MFKLTGDVAYADRFKTFMKNFKQYSPKTPKGLYAYQEWGPLRYAANTAFLALLAADYGIDAKANRQFARSQVRESKAGQGGLGLIHVAGLLADALPPCEHVTHPHRRSTTSRATTGTGAGTASPTSSASTSATPSPPTTAPPPAASKGAYAPRTPSPSRSTGRSSVREIETFMVVCWRLAA